MRTATWSIAAILFFAPALFAPAATYADDTTPRTPGNAVPATQEPPPPAPFAAPPPAPLEPPPSPPPAPPVPTSAAPEPTAEPAPPPTAEERLRAVERMPAFVVAPAPQPTPAPRLATSSADCTTCNPCAPCGTSPCAQCRDACGWRLDSCGNRIGCLEVEAVAMACAFSSPDGRLGELVANNTAELEWNDLDYPTVPGGRVTASYRYAPFDRIEVRGTYYGNPDESRTESGFFGARPGQAGVGDLSRPVDADMSSEAEAYGVELNWWTELSCVGSLRVDAGFGLRYFSFDEKARVDFTATGAGPFPIADGFIEACVENEWYGVQAMIAARFDLSQDFEAFVSLKALFGQIERRARVVDDSIFSGGEHRSSSKDDEITMGADLELGVRWRVTRHVSISAGYDLFVLDEVQRAEDTIDLSHSDTGAVQSIQAPDQLIVHSLYFGVSITF